MAAPANRSEVDLFNPIVDALPAASATWEGIRLRLNPGVGQESVYYICEQAVDNNYHWISLANGGISV